jgi:hypothetical protein
MRSKDLVSHFWVAGQPYFSTTLLIAPPVSSPSPSISGETEEGQSADKEPQPSEDREVVECVLYDMDGTQVNTVSVEFPAHSIGVVQLEPFISAMKIESGFQYGHVQVTSRIGSRHHCRVTTSNGAMQFSEPLALRSRDMSFLPLLLSPHREQMLVFVNAGTEVGQVNTRLFYGSRSPEWNIVVPPNGSKVVSLHDDLLASQDDRSWEKSPQQSYLRFTSRYQGPVSCFAIERVPGESLSQDIYRTLSLT